MEVATNFKHRQNAESINQALNLLLHEDLISVDEIKNIAAKDHMKGKQTTPSVAERFNRVVSGIQKSSLETLNRTTEKIDQSAHESPWIYVGIASALSGVAGYFIGQRFKR